MNKYLEKYWVHFNIIFIFLALIFQLIKVYKTNSFSAVHIDIPGLLLMIAGFSLLLCAFLLRKKEKILPNLILIVTGYALLCIGFSCQTDPELRWEGSDVALYNYQAGEEVVKYGPGYIISTWNLRANPFDTDSTDVFPYEAREMFSKDVYKDYMKYFTGDRWNQTSLDLNKSNNRPYMHPPLTPVVIGLWMKLIPFGRYSAQLLMILLNLTIFVLIFLKYFKERTNHFYILFFAIITTPAAILFINPSAEQLTMVLLTLAAGFLLQKDLTNSFFFPFISGLIMGLTFYTKFIVAFYIIIQIIALAVSYRTITFKPVIGYILGLFLIFVLFTLSGYYFWLTILTGKVVTELYIQANPPVTLFQLMLKLYYFGMPLIIITIYMITKIRLLKNKVVLIPLIMGIVIYMALTWKVGTFNRYLYIFVPAMFPFFYDSIKNIKFSDKGVLIVPITSLVLLWLILYL